MNDTIMLDIETGKIKEFHKFELGNLCMVTGGANNGCVIPFLLTQVLQPPS